MLRLVSALEAWVQAGQRVGSVESCNLYEQVDFMAIEADTALTKLRLQCLTSAVPVADI